MTNNISGQSNTVPGAYGNGTDSVATNNPNLDSDAAKFQEQMTVSDEATSQQSSNTQETSNESVYSGAVPAGADAEKMIEEAEKFSVPGSHDFEIGQPSGETHKLHTPNPFKTYYKP